MGPANQIVCYIVSVEQLIVHLLPYIQSCTNPVIYSYMSQSFRRRLWLTWRRLVGLFCCPCRPTKCSPDGWLSASASTVIEPQRLALDDLDPLQASPVDRAALASGSCPRAGSGNSLFGFRGRRSASCERRDAVAAPGGYGGERRAASVAATGGEGPRRPRAGGACTVDGSIFVGVQRQQQQQQQRSPTGRKSRDLSKQSKGEPSRIASMGCAGTYRPKKPDATCVSIVSEC